MVRQLSALLAGSALLAVSGCGGGYQERIAQLEARIEALEEQVGLDEGLEVGERIRVPITASDLPQRHVIVASDIVYRKMSADEILANGWPLADVVISDKHILGRTLAMDLPAGTPFYSEDFYAVGMEPAPMALRPTRPSSGAYQAGAYSAPRYESEVEEPQQQARAAAELDRLIEEAQSDQSEPSPPKRLFSSPGSEIEEAQGGPSPPKPVNGSLGGEATAGGQSALSDRYATWANRRVDPQEQDYQTPLFTRQYNEPGPLIAPEPKAPPEVEYDVYGEAYFLDDFFEPLPFHLPGYTDAPAGNLDDSLRDPSSVSAMHALPDAAKHALQTGVRPGGGSSATYSHIFPQREAFRFSDIETTAPPGQPKVEWEENELDATGELEVLP